MAEVSLHLTSTNGVLPGGSQEVVVTRRLFRSGESEYLMDGRRVRLQDIRDLMARARVGTRSYAVIEQGKVSEIVSAKPKDRRVLIEDAAGITGYKHRRRLAELKLEATRANLLRVEDILGEVEKQIRSLKRQASKARRYRRLREELRALQADLFRLRHLDLRERLEALGERLASIERREAEAAAGLGKVEASAEALKIAIRETDAAYGAAREEVHALDLDIDRAEGLIRSCVERTGELREQVGRAVAEGERLQEQLAERRETARASEASRQEAAGSLAELERRLDDAEKVQAEAQGAGETLRGELDRLAGALLEAERRLADRRSAAQSLREAAGREREACGRVTAELEEAEAEAGRLAGNRSELIRESETGRVRLTELRALRDATRAERESLRQAHDEAEAAHHDARDRQRTAAARLATLERLETLYAGQDAVQAVLRYGPDRDVRPRGTVADLVAAERDVEDAAEGYLADLLPVMVVGSPAEAVAGIRLLRERSAGRAAFLPCDGGSAAGALGADLPRGLLGAEGVVGPLADGVRLNTPLNGAVAERLSRAVVVRSLEAAFELAARWPDRDWVTVEGDVLDRRGIVRGGTGDGGDGGLLARRRTIAELRAEVGRLGADEETRARQRGEARSRLDEAAARLEALSEQEAHGRQEAEVVSVRLEKLDEEMVRAGEKRDALRAERERVETEATRREAEAEAAAAEAVGLEATRQREEGAAERRRAELMRCEESARAAGEEVARLRAERAATRERTEALAAEARRLVEETGELEGRVEAAESAAREARERIRELESTAEQTRTGLAEKGESRVQAEERARAAERKLREDRAVFEAEESRIGELRTGLEAVREDRSEAAVEHERVASDLRHLGETCQEELGEALEVVVARHPEPADDGAASEEEHDAESLAERVADVRRRIDTLGPVNMMAVEQVDELDERFQFLTTQRNDLVSSIESLQATIRKINETSRELFEQAFTGIRENYQTLFKILFDGGTADLRLEDESDPLECGIEIVAQPPGKRLGRVSLLSGGEKALSAVALLFAIFRYQPSPFCLLDEVDAPLDDTNVGRFAKMLKEFCDHTQFILITHNKQSMEYADILYGVTMPEPGVSRMVSMALD
jgi:chromosome segregation protein